MAERPVTDPTPARTTGLVTEEVGQHIVEIVSDSGEGAQTCGQLFATVSAKMGNGVWTVEIIPAEIEPPHRSRAGASGNRIRIASDPVHNMGETADVVIALNEQVLYSRIDVGALRAGTVVFLEKHWGDQLEDTRMRDAYREALADFAQRGYRVIETPIREDCLKLVSDPRRGRNMWALGLLAALYQRDMDLLRREVTAKLGRKGKKVLQSNLDLVEAGYRWTEQNVDFRYCLPVKTRDEAMVVMNGNQAVALGAMAAGIEVCAMYPITPATSVSHFLAAEFHKVGGIVHQAEDEIAAIGFALGASYAGKTAMSVTSGPGLCLKTEFLGLAVMAELPLVLVVVQRGSPSTGLPTRVEQGDLLAAIHGEPGDAPKIVIAPTSIEECFHFMVTARQLAETFRGPVIVLTDANLATAQTPFPRPTLQADWLSPPLDQADWDGDLPPYAWDPKTGLSRRPIPGQRGGCYVLTGLAHDEHGRVAYESATNQRSMTMRARKLITLQRSLQPPRIYGDDEGDLLVVGWGSTRGAIEEAVDALRAEGRRVSTLSLRFLSPLEPGLKAIFQRFRQVLTVEINYSDDSEDTDLTDENRDYSQLAWILRAKTLVDVQCWSRVPGTPLPPGRIAEELRRRLDQLAASADSGGGDAPCTD